MAQGLGAAPPTQQLFVHQVGDLAEVLSNLGVFRMHPEDVLALCPSGFRRVPIHQGSDHYLSLQGFAPDQITGSTEVVGPVSTMVGSSSCSRYAAVDRSRPAICVSMAVMPGVTSNVTARMARSVSAVRCTS